MRNVFLIIDCLLTKKFSNYKIKGDGFSVEYSKGKYILINNENYSEYEGLIDFYSVLHILNNSRLIKQIEVKGKVIDFSTYDDILRELHLTSILCFEKTDILYHEGVYYRVIRDSRDDQRIIKVLETDYKNLLINMRGTLRYIIPYEGDVKNWTTS